MKYLFTWLLFLIVLQTANAQQNFYAIFQSANKAPFFIKYKAKIYSSSPSGFLILPKLTNGDQVVKIGLPKSEVPENTFTFTVSNTDANYLLQIENSAVLTLKESKTNSVVYAKGNEPASTIATTPVIEPKPAINVGTNEPIAINNLKIEKVDTPKPTEIPIAQEPKVIQVNNVPVTAKNVNEEQTNVKRIIDSSLSKNGFTIYRYIVNYNGQLDTITVELPTSTKPILLDNDIDNSQSKSSGTDLIKSDTNANSDTVKINNVEKIDDKTKSEPTVEKVPSLINSNCTKIATNNDYIALRKKMAGYSEAVKLNEIAIKAFKKKCHSTEQIKGLAGLYSSDLERVNFFLIAYPFVIDTTNFKLLVNELKSEQAISLFREKVIK